MKKVLWLFILLFIIAAAISVFLKKVEVKYKDVIDKTAEEYSLDKNLVYALVKAESGFDADAESHRGAFGLMQLTANTAAWCAENVGDAALAAEFTVPEVNVKLGCFYLKYLLDKYDGEETTALAAYNAGSKNVDEWLLDKEYSPDGIKITAAPFPETDRYIKKIAFYKKMYTLLYGE